MKQWILFGLAVVLALAAALLIMAEPVDSLSTQKWIMLLVGTKIAGIVAGYVAYIIIRYLIINLNLNSPDHS